MTTQTNEGMIELNAANLAGVDEMIENGATDAPANKTVKKPAAKTAKREGVITYAKNKGKWIFSRTAAAEESKILTEALMKNFGVKEINGFVADMLGVETVGGAKDNKQTAINRFFRTAYDKLPLTKTEEKAADKPAKKKSEKKADKPVKSFVVSFDPADEEQSTAFEQLAPQGKACVLAALGLKHPPKEARTATITSKELEAVLEARRDVFETEQPLRRIWGYHRPMLVAGGFLAVNGGKGGSRATDKYTYAFHFTPSAKNAEKFEELPPQAQACLQIALGRKKFAAEGEKLEREIVGADWRTKLFKAKASGDMVTKQNPFRIFQYHEHLLVDAGFLNVRS